MTDIDAKIDELTKRVDGIDLTSKAEMWLMLQQSAQRQYSPVFNSGGYFSPGAPYCQSSQNWSRVYSNTDLALTIPTFPAWATACSILPRCGI